MGSLKNSLSSWTCITEKRQKNSINRYELCGNVYTRMFNWVMNIIVVVLWLGRLQQLKSTWKPRPAKGRWWQRETWLSNGQPLKHRKIQCCIRMCIRWNKQWLRRKRGKESEEKVHQNSEIIPRELQTNEPFEQGILFGRSSHEQHVCSRHSIAHPYKYDVIHVDWINQMYSALTIVCSPIPQQASRSGQIHAVSRKPLRWLACGHAIREWQKDWPFDFGHTLFSHEYYYLINVRTRERTHKAILTSLNSMRLEGKLYNPKVVPVFAAKTIIT